MTWEQARDSVFAFLVSGSYIWLVHEVRNLTRLVQKHEIKDEMYQELHVDFEMRLRELERGRS